MVINKGKFNEFEQSIPEDRACRISFSSSSSWVLIRHHLTTVARLAFTLALLLGPLIFSSSSFSLTRDSVLPLLLSFPGRPQPFSSPLFLLFLLSALITTICVLRHVRWSIFSLDIQQLLGSQVGSVPLLNCNQRSALDERPPFHFFELTLGFGFWIVGWRGKL